MELHRSYLFAPGNHSRKVAKVFEAGADAVILDLEDAVATSEKEATRAVVVEALQHPRSCRGYVRINGLDTPYAFGDLEAVVTGGVDGIVLPMVESAADLCTADWVIGALEHKAGLPPGAIDLMPIIETGKGLAHVREICAAGGRTRRIAFGAADYTQDMGMEWTPGELECQPARAEIVLASRVAGLEAPVDTVWTRLADDAGLRASTETVCSMGFQGKFCIHPAQIPFVHEVFTPSTDEIAHAREVVAAFDEAEQQGSASIQVGGIFVDYPVVARARKVLAIAKAADPDDAV